jgi:hypothetical protein
VDALCATKSAAHEASAVRTLSLCSAAPFVAASSSADALSRFIFISIASFSLSNSFFNASVASRTASA